MIGRRCFLIDFPSGYKMFTHTKDGRIDHYLIGSKTVGSFRSPQEFFLHARWLMMGAKEDSEGYPDCECKYCGGTRSQREIDEEFQLPGRKDSRLKSSGRCSGRQGGPSAATSEVIISQAKDYRNLKKTEYGGPASSLQRCPVHRPRLTIIANTQRFCVFIRMKRCISQMFIAPKYHTGLGNIELVMQ